MRKRGRRVGSGAGGGGGGRGESVERFVEVSNWRLSPQS